MAESASRSSDKQGIGVSRQSDSFEIPISRSEPVRSSSEPATQPPVDEHRTATVTVAVISADLRNAHTQKCLERLKLHTQNFDLWILDNNNSTAFNHSREMNKVLKSATTDFVVLMDDDGF